jgi:AraC family transcriptional regulator, ethanolamine operon transcriptional activator
MNFQKESVANTSVVNSKLHSISCITSDVIDHAESLPFWSQDYTQLSKGSFSGELTSVSYQNLQIFRESMNRAVDEIASAPLDTYVIGLSTANEGNSTWGLLPVKPNSLITLDKNSELIFRTANNSDITAAAIPAQRLEEYASSVEWIDLRKVMSTIKPVETISQNSARKLQSALVDGIRYMSDIHEDVDTDIVWHHFEDELMATCLQTLLEASDNKSPNYDHRIHRYIVNRVRDATLSSSGYPLTIGELCTELRISRRTLNFAFSRVLGITPVAYMRNIRLHRIRAEFKSSSHRVRSVADVASKWGFWHMSLFSRYYKELFGETPHETLIRHRMKCN